MKAPHYELTTVVHLDGDDRNDIVEAMLRARNAIGKDDELIYGIVDVFVYGDAEPPVMKTSSDGMSCTMTWRDTMISCDYDYQHGNETLHGTHNISLTELVMFEKVYRRNELLQRRKNKCGTLGTSCFCTTKGVGNGK